MILQAVVIPLKQIKRTRGLVQPVIIVAHSMRGVIATTFALKYKEKVAGIVYISAFVDGQQLRTLGTKPEMLTETVSTPSGAVDFYRPFNIPESLLLATAKCLLHSFVANAYAHVNYDLAEKYTDIQVPVFIIHGSSDVPTPEDLCGTGLRNAISGARLEILTGANHFPSVEVPERTTLLIKTLIRKCE